ncbi:MAG: DUF4292 domain-containing protein [Bacteroidaceae bacterium]|nr:DUF4292 domain-containing protein [Bacteroidaceae bacterium]
MKKIAGLLGLILLMTVTFSSCRSTKSAEKGNVNTNVTTLNNTTYATSAFSSANYFKMVKENQTKEENLTAKLKVTIQMNGKSISTSGSLKMKKDDVIQISLVDPIVGIAEVGKMEFTKDHVLVIDRFNKQYFDVPYEEVSFLKRANVDFNTLQSLFWNEIFQPGANEPNADAFSYTKTDGSEPKDNQGKVNIGYKDQMLNYRFETQQPTGQLDKTVISSNDDQSAQFSFDYADFEKFEKTQFPTEMVMTFVMGNKNASLSLSLSSMDNNSKWNTRTTAPSKYTKADADKVFKSLVK